MAKKRGVAGRVVARSGGGQSLISLVQKFDRAEAACEAARQALDARQGELNELRRQLAARLGGGGLMSAARSSARLSRSPQGMASNAAQPRAGTLKHAILQIMADGGTRGPTDVFDAVKKSSFKSDGSEKSQRVMVAQTLTRLVQSGHLVREGRVA